MGSLDSCDCVSASASGLMKGGG